MTNADEIQVTPGSGFFAMPMHSKKQGGWYYNLREITRSQRRGKDAVAQKAGTPRRPTPAC